MLPVLTKRKQQDKLALIRRRNLIQLKGLCEAMTLNFCQASVAENQLLLWHIYDYSAATESSRLKCNSNCVLSTFSCLMKLLRLMSPDVENPILVRVLLNMYVAVVISFGSINHSHSVCISMFKHILSNFKLQSQDKVQCRKVIFRCEHSLELYGGFFNPPGGLHPPLPPTPQNLSQWVQVEHRNPSLCYQKVLLLLVQGATFENHQFKIQ